MKTKLYISVVLAVTYFLCTGQTQISSNYTIDSLQHFNRNFWLNKISQTNPSLKDEAEFMQAQERQYIKDTYYPSQKLPQNPPTIQQACTNIDFESGNTNGWSLTSGFNPLYNASGCCPTVGGAQAIMSGAGIDPCGGFPVVSPGGLFSIRLGNNGTGGFADRMEQTFFVTAGNSNFTYKYAVVFQDPGHTIAQQPAFTVQMIDTFGVAIPCTYYNVSAGQNLPGFQNSPNCPGVVYKPWTNVVVDLSTYIGQSVTIRFTTYDCSLGGHYGYAYIDGSCVAFQTTTLDTLCVGSSKQICAPPGFGSYVWSGGNLTGNTNSCVTVSNPGNYSVQTTLVTGCLGPVFYYPIFNHPTPNANFNTPGNNNNCGLTVNFNNTSSMSSGTMTTYFWDFGDATTSTIQNPVHTYANPGTYLVTLIVGSNAGCFDTTVNLVTVNPPPVVAFTYSTICQGSPVTFNDNSSVTQGNINQWIWDFGDGSVNSLLQNPSHIYSLPGNYIVTLTVTTNQNCTATGTQVVTVNALPNVSFNASNICLGNATTFNNTSTGNITTWMWDINGDGIVDSNTQNLTYNYVTANTYTVILTASSNANCINSFSTTVTIHPLPIINIAGNNVCHNAVTTFSNNSTITNGNIITNYVWSFGNSTSSIQTNPLVIYTNPGSYLVSLTGTSNNNCVNTGTTLVNVWPNPNASFSSANVCLGTTNYFTNNSTITSGNITNWMWDVNGDNNTDSTSQNPTYVYTAAGNYVVSLTAISNNNCTNTFTSSITVNPLPNASFIASNSCLGTTTTFTNQSTIGTGNQITSYFWNFGSNNTSTTANPILNYYTIGNYTVSLIATSNNNCQNTYTSVVSIYANPNVNFVATTTCLNQATQFTNSSTIQAGTIVKYRWDFDDNSTWDDSTANPMYIYPTFGFKNCKLQGISNNNCYSQKINLVIVHGNPVANFKANSTCFGDVTTFQNYSTSTDGAITSYMWDFNGDNVTDNISTNPTLTYTANGVYLTKLEVQNQYGCVNVISKAVYVNAKPVAMFTATNKVGCPSLCVPFTNTSYITPGTIVTYQWDFGDGSGPLYLKNPIHCYNTGTFNVSLVCVSDSGCISKYTSPSLVNVYPTPVAGFNVTPEEIDEFEPIIEVTNTALGASSVSYMLNPGPVFNTPNFTYNLNSNGPGKQLVVQFATNIYGCKDTLAKIIDIKPGFVIYLPNAFTPNGDGLNDGFGAKGVGILDFQIQVFDRWGHVVFHSNDIYTYWDGTVKNGDEPIKDDVYTWKVQVLDVFHKNHDLTGHVTVLK